MDLPTDTDLVVVELGVLDSVAVDGSEGKVFDDIGKDTDDDWSLFVRFEKAVECSSVCKELMRILVTISLTFVGCPVIVVVVRDSIDCVAKLVDEESCWLAIVVVGGSVLSVEVEAIGCVGNVVCSLEVVLDAARAVDILPDEDELLTVVESSINVGSKDWGPDVSGPTVPVVMLLDLLESDFPVDEVDTPVRSGSRSKDSGLAEGLCEAEVVEDPRWMVLVWVEDE